MRTQEEKQERAVTMFDNLFGDDVTPESIALIDSMLAGIEEDGE